MDSTAARGHVHVQQDHVRVVLQGSGIALGTVPALPTISRSLPSSARTPNRKSSWSSTTKTRTVTAAHRQLEHDLRPAHDLAVHLGGATVPLQPTDDRVGDPASVAAHGGRIEARAVVAHECADRPIFDLDVDRYLPRPGATGGVQRAFATGGDQGAHVIVERSLADDDRLHADLVLALDAAAMASIASRRRAFGTFGARR